MHAGVHLSYTCMWMHVGTCMHMHVCSFAHACTYMWVHAHACGRVHGCVDGALAHGLVPVVQMMQKLGKSDQTKDEVFEDFVANFNRQSVSVT